MSRWLSHPTRAAALAPEPIVPDTIRLSRLFVVSVPTDLVLVGTWSAVGLVASISLAVTLPLADPLGTLLAF